MISEREAKLKAVYEILREDYRASLYETARVLLGFNKITEDHRALCDWIQERANPRALRPGYYVIQQPRETYKSTIVSTALPIWLLMNNPNLAIMLGSAVQKNASRWLNVIKRKIVSRIFRKIFG